MLDAAAVAQRLGLGEAHRPWLGDLVAAGPPPEPLRLPTAAAAEAQLLRLGATALDASEAAAALPSAADPELRWLLERCWSRLLQTMGRPELGLPDWPALPPELGAPGRFLPVHAFLAAEPAVRAWHGAHGVPPEATAETLGSLGRALAIHRRRQGVPGVFELNWMRLPFRACLFELGRLQYTPYRLAAGGRWWSEQEAARLGPGFRPGDATVGLHIPASGPLLAEACDASLVRARALFGAPGPFGPCRIATCGSWLLDEQLSGLLPETSNILRFQRRFQLLAGGGDADGSVLSFVFHRDHAVPLEHLPQGTTLERGAVRHWRAGGHFRSRSGWLRL